MMKKFRPIATVLILSLAAMFLLQSCGSAGSSESKPGAQVDSTVASIPYLKARKEGLGSPDEFTNVAGIYDKQKAVLEKDAQNAEAFLALAELFMNEARVTGEHPYYYPAALKMIDMIPNLKSRSQDLQFQAAYFKSTIQLSQHEFQKALVTGEEGRKIFPDNAGIHGVLIDANVELGHYEEAVRLSDIMVGIRPDLRSYSRISYLREIHGDPDGAIEAMKLAVDAAMPGYEQSAWCRLTLAKLYENYGKLDEAKMHYTIILQERPAYPFAYSGLASIAMKKGDTEAAGKLLDSAIALIPEVAFYEQRSELMQRLGNEPEAKAIAAEVMVMMAEDQASGHLVDLELAMAQLHLQNDPESAKISAEKAYAARPENIDVNAALAEIHYTLGDFLKAQEFMKVALRTGSKDPAKNCVAGLVEVAAGNKAAGLAQIKAAFKSNPYLDHPLAAKAKAIK